jgi:hypothetical protein
MTNRMTFEQSRSEILRRSFLKTGTYCVGSLALTDLLQKEMRGAESAQKSHPGLHHPAKIKRVIHLCMSGGPSHLESFDPKPELDKLDGMPFPESFTKGQQLAQLQNTVLKARGAFCKFEKRGESGIPIADIFPHIGTLADDMCVIRSMHTEQINHDPALGFINSGSIQKGRPSMGSWLLYGLGSENDSLPGFVVLVSQAKKGGVQPVSARHAVHYVRPPGGISSELQKSSVQQINRLNRMQWARTGDPEIETRIGQYEMAFRMQSSVPELTDLKSEPQSVLDDYGIKQPGDGTYASNCLMARRLAERGVRFIQLYHRAWDHHGNIQTDMPSAALEVDQSTAALVKDLKQRGMLDDTLIIWGGEFGRTPMGQGSGRDHHINAFSIWLAGGGIKGGTIYGATDELGYRYIDDGTQVHVRDLHATMLHLFGIDHARFTHKFLGLDARLTGVEPARILKEILA